MALGVFKNLNLGSLRDGSQRMGWFEMIPDLCVRITSFGSRNPYLQHGSSGLATALDSGYAIKATVLQSLQETS